MKILAICALALLLSAAAGQAQPQDAAQNEPSRDEVRQATDAANAETLDHISMQSRMTSQGAAQANADPASRGAIAEGRPGDERFERRRKAEIEEFNEEAKAHAEASPKN